MSVPGFAEAKAAIRARFAALWIVGAAPRTPVHWPNLDPFTPPVTAWVRLTILFGEGNRIALGPRLDRWSGQVIVQVFTPKGEGDGPADALCDAVGEIYSPNTTLQGGGRIQFRTPTVRAVPGDPRWFQNNVLCPFQRDRTT